MKTFLNYLALMLLLSMAGMMVSCDKDDEALILKKVGSLNIRVQNEGQNLANTQVRISNAQTNNELKVVKTDENGLIKLEDLLEGTYNITVEVESPTYRVAEQPFQVISGQTREVTMEVTAHTGSSKIFLTDTYNDNRVYEDLKIGLAIIPNSLAYKKAITNKEKVALATAVHYFGTSGEINFTDIPTGDYIIFRVAADTIVSTWKDFYSIEREVEKKEEYKINFYQTLAFLKSPFEVKSFTAKDNMGNLVTTSPFKSFRFYNNYGSYYVEITMQNDVVFNTYGSISANGRFNFSSTYSNGRNYYFDISWNRWFSYKNGQLILTVSSMSIDDKTAANDDKYYENVTIVMQ